MQTHLQAARGAHPRSRHEQRIDWQGGLPRPWLSQVVKPVVFTCQRDYEIDASRVLGHEGEGEAPCFCRFNAVLSELRSDDDEMLYSAPVYAEQLTGWRLIDGRWLIHRHIIHGEDCQAAQSFFTLADEMPR